MNERKVGEENRHKNRLKHTEAVKNKSTELLAISFPAPSAIPSEALFLSGWETFSQSLIDTFGKQTDYRLAFNHAVNQIKAYQNKYSWPYSPPSHLITNKPSTQLRDQSWLKGAWALHDSYQQWKEASTKGDVRNINFRYQSLLLSLLMDSGHCNIDIIKSFNLLLKTTKDIQIQSFSKYTFVPLHLNNEHLNSNDYQDGEPITIYQCYFSLKTLGQLKLWQKLSKEDWEYPSDAKELLAVMINNFPSHKNIPKTSRQFCSCAAFSFETDSNPNISEALLEYRVGRTRSYSLPTSNLKRLIKPTLYPVESTSFYSFSTNMTVSHKYKNLIKTDGLSLRENQYIGELKKACISIISGEKVSSKTVKTRLEILLTQYQLEPWQQIFIQWLIYKTHGCSAKTIHKYMLNQIKYWCLMNTKYSLASVSSNIDLEEIYQEQIDHHATAKSKKYYIGRLKELHAFALPLLELPALSNDFFYLDTGKSHTRAGIVDEYLFKGLLKHIEQLTDLNHIDRLAIQTICIISYRCALRMAELYKLKINNLENSITGWIEIRPNNLGDNKTASGLRKLPLFPLLLEDENQIVSEYISYKKSLSIAKSSPLLTIGEDVHRPFNMFTVSNYVGKVLRALSGEEHFVFYHLRHSCISRLQLILEHNEPTSAFQNFCSYSKEQTTIIKRLLFKDGLSYGYWEIAAFSGHESPHTTFEHYFHLSDLLASPSPLEQDVEVSLKETQSQGFCSRRQFQALFKKNGKVTQGDCAVFLKKHLSINNIEKEIEQAPTSKISLASSSGEQITLNVCYQVLEAISTGERVDTLAYAFRLKKSTIIRWLINTKYLKSLYISSNNKRSLPENEDESISRHFSLGRAHALVPGKLKTKEEIKYADRVIKLLRINYKDNAKSIIKMMRYSLRHTSINKSGITFNSPEKMTEFIDTFQFSIPKSHWRAVKLYINTSVIKQEWQASLKGMTTTEEKKGTKNGRSGKGSIRLELISPSEKQYISNGKVDKYSSHLLIYIMYMSFVILRQTDETT